MARCLGITAVGVDGPVRCKRPAVHGSVCCQLHGGLETTTTPEKVRRSNPRMRCTATRKRDGQPCTNWAIKGSNVCRKHGGATPQVREKAKERLLAMVEPALVELNKIVRSKNTSDADKLRAIQMILDRTGYNGKISIDIEEPAWHEIVEGILVDVWVADDTIDAEVIEEHPALEAGDAAAVTEPAAVTTDDAPAAAAGGDGGVVDDFERLAAEREAEMAEEAWQSVPDAAVTKIYAAAEAPEPTVAGWRARSHPAAGSRYAPGRLNGPARH